MHVRCVGGPDWNVKYNTEGSWCLIHIKGKIYWVDHGWHLLIMYYYIMWCKEWEPKVLELKIATKNNSNTNNGHKDSEEYTKTRNKLVLWGLSMKII